MGPAPRRWVAAQRARHDTVTSEMDVTTTNPGQPRSNRRRDVTAPRERVGAPGGGPRTRRQSRTGVALAVPALVLVVLVLGGALVALAMTATGLMPLVGPPRPSWDAFASSWPDLVVSAQESLLISVAATGISAVVGFGVALLILRRGRAIRLLAAAMAAPIPVAHLVGAASFGLLLADSGVASRILGGSLDGWPQLVGGRWPVATVAEFAWKESAFTALVITAALAPRIREYQEAASLLGAGRWARLRHVVLPLAAPALCGAGIIVFLYTLGSYEVAWILGRAYPETLPVTAYRLFGSIDLAARPQAAAAALATTLLALAAAAAAVPLARRLGGAR